MKDLDWAAVLTGVSSSFVASALFILALFRIRPSLKISPELAKTSDKKGDTVFVFKVLNKSWFFSIYDLKCDIRVYEKSNSHNAEDKHRRHHEVKLIGDSNWVVNRFNVRHLLQFIKPDKKLDTRTDYAAQFGTKFDIIKLINDDKLVIAIHVIAKHPLSGFSKVITEEYSHVSQIKEGSFCSGNTFKIK